MSRFIIYIILTFAMSCAVHMIFYHGHQALAYFVGSVLGNIFWPLFFWSIKEIKDVYRQHKQLRLQVKSRAKDQCDL